MNFGPPWGDLTQQEKVLLYMLFDLTACIGEPPQSLLRTQ
jgi:hypothetical protein